MTAKRKPAKAAKPRPKAAPQRIVPTARPVPTTPTASAVPGKPRKLRLLKVLVTPFWALDDGETLVEVTVDPMMVTPVDWPVFSGKPFADWQDTVAAEIEKQGLGLIPPKIG